MDIKVIIVIIAILVIIFVAVKNRYGIMYDALGTYNSAIAMSLPAHENKPFLPLEMFPEHKLLQDNWQTIREEANKIVDKARKAKDISPIAFEQISEESEEKWKLFMLVMNGKEFEKNTKLCPKTTELIKKIPRIKMAMFSIMLPGNYVQPHVGPFKGVMRYHLGLKVPKDRKNVFINVADQKYHWKEGEGVLFDDTYKHWVANKTDETRIILFCDIERDVPGLCGHINSYILNKTSLPEFFFFINSMQEKPDKIIKGDGFEDFHVDCSPS